MPAAPSRETVRRRWARLGFAREVEVDGLRLHYVEAGTGPAVFLLHGMGDCAIGWRGQLEPLAEAGFRAIAWDMPGAGLSVKPLDRAYSIAAVAEVFEEFRARLGIERGALVGSSYGGGVALLHARLQPERVPGLVVIDPACYSDGVGAYTRLFKNPWFNRLVYPLVPARTLVRIGLRQCVPDLSVLGPGILEEYAAEARRPGAKSAFARFEQDVVPDDPAPFEAGHREIRVPTLVLWGRRDRVLPLDHGERLAREIPGARLLVLEAEHIPHVERPEETNRAILAFLREHRAPAGGAASGARRS
ncbi:MAG TPA: alpha/beta fold hydrolase [Planctomycetota bacterium]|jgi:pimeloyl-ACP methyl ester carboxylesterase|nr:alpha/beta fold hydrolase [Planctomycetota bacterium]